MFQLLDCYLEAYHHVFDRDERRNLAQVITNVMHKRPRYDFTSPYFVKGYRMESVNFRLHAQLVKDILNNQVSISDAFAMISHHLILSKVSNLNADFVHE